MGQNRLPGGGVRGGGVDPAAYSIEGNGRALFLSASDTSEEGEVALSNQFSSHSILVQ